MALPIALIDTSPGQGDSGKVGGDKINMNFLVVAEEVDRLSLAAGLYVNVRDYMKGGAFTDEAKAAELVQLQAAIAAAVAAKKPLYIPPGGTALRINGTAIIPDGGVNIMGGGTIISSVDAPIFRTNGKATDKIIKDFTATFELGGALPVNACAVEIGGAGGTNFYQYCGFENITCLGGIACVIVTIGTRTTAFGEESACNWCRFTNLDCRGSLTGATDARNIVWFKAGSGTGNVFTGLRGRLGSTAVTSGVSAYARFDGAGCVVGDIIINGSHQCSATIDADCATVEVGPDTVYRNNISVVACQADSNMTRVFRIGTGTVLPTNLYHDGSLLGGLTVMGISAPLSTMNLADRDQGVWTGGKVFVTNNTTGSQAQPICRVGLAVFRSVKMEITVTGLVGGVSAGVLSADVILYSTASTVNVIVENKSVNPSGLFDITTNVSGRVVTINVTLAPTSIGTEIAANWSGKGRGYYIERL